jgi:hypothetical protein
VICSLDTTSKRRIEDLADISGERLRKSEYTHILRADISNSVDLLESDGRINLPVVSNALCTHKAIFTSVNDFIIGN